MREIRTMSVVVGSAACDAKCPYCISKMTGIKDHQHCSMIHGRNCGIACDLAKAGGATTVLLTGKGEPTLYPEEIWSWLQFLKKWNFPFKDLQTNGLKIAEERLADGCVHINDYLGYWYEAGLTTICISVVGPVNEHNRRIFVPDRDVYIDLPKVVEKLKNYGYIVRLNCTMLKGVVDSVERVNVFLNYARNIGAHQVSLRPMRVPVESEKSSIYEWAIKNTVSEKFLKRLHEYFESKYGSRTLMKLAHNAKLYDVDGLAVSNTDCLTKDPDSDELRQVIVTTSGKVTYDWQFKAAMFLPEGK